MTANSEPVYYQLLSGESTALSAPPGPNPGGDLVNATPDDTSELQLWELVVNLISPAGEGDSLRVAMRNKYTGFAAAAPLGDNTWGVTQQGFDPDNSSPALLWTFVSAGDFAQAWAIRPAGRENQNLNAMGDAEIGSEVGIRGWSGGQPLEVWSAVRVAH
jgi:hypothetical protein